MAGLPRPKMFRKRVKRESTTGTQNFLTNFTTFFTAMFVTKPEGPSSSKSSRLSLIKRLKRSRSRVAPSLDDELSQARLRPQTDEAGPSSRVEPDLPCSHNVNRVAATEDDCVTNFVTQVEPFHPIEDGKDGPGGSTHKPTVCVPPSSIRPTSPNRLTLDDPIPSSKKVEERINMDAVESFHQDGNVNDPKPVATTNSFFDMMELASGRLPSDDTKDAKSDKTPNKEKNTLDAEIVDSSTHKMPDDESSLRPTSTKLSISGTGDETDKKTAATYEYDINDLMGVVRLANGYGHGGIDYSSSSPTSKPDTDNGVTGTGAVSSVSVNTTNSGDLQNDSDSQKVTLVPVDDDQSDIQGLFDILSFANGNSLDYLDNDDLPGAEDADTADKHEPEISRDREIIEGNEDVKVTEDQEAIRPCLQGLFDVLSFANGSSLNYLDDQDLPGSDCCEIEVEDDFKKDDDWVMINESDIASPEVLQVDLQHGNSPTSNTTDQINSVPQLDNTETDPKTDTPVSDCVDDYFPPQSSPTEGCIDVDSAKAIKTEMNAVIEAFKSDTSMSCDMDGCVTRKTCSYMDTNAASPDIHEYDKDEEEILDDIVAPDAPQLNKSDEENINSDSSSDDGFPCGNDTLQPLPSLKEDDLVDMSTNGFESPEIPELGTSLREECTTPETNTVSSQIRLPSESDFALVEVQIGDKFSYHGDMDIEAIEAAARQISAAALTNAFNHISDLFDDDEF
ncbi:uncharacterized protein [Clytia hemisphaerica]|uniref:uncharacterized protein n=1 Tax=Clytia hemisphaerica TaxID=252671 RepID=UPI0034D6D361